MAYDFSNAGRVREQGSAGGRFLTFADVEGRLILAVRLCWREEAGRWPFAGDGPWHLVEKEIELAGVGVEDGDERAGRAPLSHREMAERDEAIGWLRLVSADFDRRLIVLAVTQLAKGGRRARVSWLKLAKMLDAVSADALRVRYGRVMSALTACVNAVQR